jgi:hypothetical protein
MDNTNVNRQSLSHAHQLTQRLGSIDLIQDPSKLTEVMIAVTVMITRRGLLQKKLLTTDVPEHLIESCNAEVEFLNSNIKKLLAL